MSSAPSAAPTVQRSRGSQQTKRPARRSSRETSLNAPAPVTEVFEGNQETDWALCENSVTELDSQRQGLSSRSDYDKLAPSQYDEADPFSGVRKRDR